MIYSSKNQSAYLIVASLGLLLSSSSSNADSPTHRQTMPKRQSAIHRELELATESVAETDAAELDTKKSSKPRDSFRNLASRGQSIARTAIRYEGSPYSYGGTSLQNGIDCSAFVQAIYSQFGVNLPRVARQQFTVGESVERENLRPGDLVFFKNTYKSGISHVGMFIGSDKFIHAAGIKKGIIISQLSSKNYLKNWAGARRPGFRADAIDDIVTRTTEVSQVERPSRTKHRILIDADDKRSQIDETEVASKSDRRKRQTMHTDTVSFDVESETSSDEEFTPPVKHHSRSKGR